MVRKRKPLNENGQSSLEFVLTFILFLVFVLFFFQLSMILAFGNYAHYATFMAARAYLSAGANPQDQQERATNVIVQTLKRSAGQTGTDKFPSIAQGVGGGSDIPGLDIFSQSNPPNNWTGIRYTFTGKVFIVPLFTLNLANSKIPNNTLTLTSESWLGRDPTQSECKTYMDQTLNGAIYDNGC